MIFPGGDSGERPRDEGEYGRNESPPSGAHEAPPIEQMPQPAYGTPPPSQDYPQQGHPPPGYQPYPPPQPDYGQQYYPGSYPPPGYPQHAGYGPPAPAKTNRMAVASLSVSIVGLLCGIGSIIGIVLGFIARSQIRQTPQPGYGLAIAGIVVGISSLIISLIWMIYAVR
jgi:Domain of unknown function (DUF4190)